MGEGLEVGSGVGTNDGSKVGTREGLEVGSGVGTNDGTKVGTSEGFEVGSGVTAAQSECTPESQGLRCIGDNRQLPQYAPPVMIALRPLSEYTTPLLPM